jgi:hypothetical protein
LVRTTGQASGIDLSGNDTPKIALSYRDLFQLSARVRRLTAMTAAIAAKSTVFSSAPYGQ